MICPVILLLSTKENAYYSSPAGHPAGIVVDAIRFHGLTGLAATFCLDLMSSFFLARELVYIL